MRLAIVVAALSFASGIALTALAMRVNQRKSGEVIVASSPSDEPAAASTPIDELAGPRPPKAILPGVPTDAESLADDAWPPPRLAPDSETVEIQLTGANYQWEIRYLDLAGLASTTVKPWPGSKACQEIHLPAQTNLQLRLKSRDFVYLLTVPRVEGGPNQRSQIAVPNQLYTLDFNSGPAGTLVLRGDHFCGWPRPSLDLTVIVESQQEFQAWINKQRK